MYRQLRLMACLMALLVVAMPAVMVWVAIKRSLPATSIPGLVIAELFMIQGVVAFLVLRHRIKAAEATWERTKGQS